MSSIEISVYGRPSQGMEGRMDIDRRRLLKAATCLALTRLAGPLDAGISPEADQIPVAQSWHPLTRSLVHRAQNARSSGKRANTSQVDRIIRETAVAQGCAKSPVIKWLADPSCAFDHLSGYGLDALLKMSTASLWRRAGPPPPSDDRSLDLSRFLGGVIADIVGAEDHDRALMAPKLLAKRRAIAENVPAEAIFEIRAVAAQIGWLETCMPIAAVQAVANVELFLSSGVSEHDESVSHQLRVFEAYERGLLATWETPTAIICVPRPIAV
jgi:hypothetical protein